MGLMWILCDVTGSRNPTWRPQNRKYLYVGFYTILQRHSNGYPNVFRVQELTIEDTAQCYQKSETQDGVRLVSIIRF